MAKYPLIADHGLIGDLQTAALVATDGSIDWFCSPRFDSPSIFGSLLDAENGGHFRIRPTVDTFDAKQLYFPDTAILITRFMAEDGVGELVDFMPISGNQPPTERHRLVRMLRCVRGAMTFDFDDRSAVRLRPRPHTSLRSPSRRVIPVGLGIGHGARRSRADGRTAGTSRCGQHGRRVPVPLRAGDTRGMVLETDSIGKPTRNKARRGAATFESLRWSSGGWLVADRPIRGAGARRCSDRRSR